jgi:hypothetical protein
MPAGRQSAMSSGCSAVPAIRSAQLIRSMTCWRSQTCRRSGVNARLEPFRLSTWTSGLISRMRVLTSSTQGRS